MSHFDHDHEQHDAPAAPHVNVPGRHTVSVLDGNFPSLRLSLENDVCQLSSSLSSSNSSDDDGATHGRWFDIGHSLAAHRNLQLLSVANCGLTDHGASILAPQLPITLVELDVGGNRALTDHGITLIAQRVSVHPRLLKLGLSNVNLTPGGLKAICSLLVASPSGPLQSLCLSNNPQCGGDGGVVALSAALTTPTCTLQSLDMSTTGLREDHALRLGDALQRNTSLATLVVSHNPLIGVVGAAHILVHALHLHELVLNGNQLGSASTPELLGNAVGRCRLRGLSLVQNFLSEVHLAELARGLEQATNHTLQSLNLADNTLRDHSLHRLTAALARLPQFQRLDVHCNAITDIGMTDPAVLENFSRMAALTCLNLRQNAAVRSIGALTAALSHHPQLTQLVLSHNVHLGAAGAAAVANLLQHCHTLRMVELGNAAIGDQGALSLAHVLAGNPALTHLDVSHNGIGAAGAAGFAVALATNTQLLELFLHHNDIGVDGVDALRAALQESNFSLLSLAVGDVPKRLPDVLDIDLPLVASRQNSDSEPFSARGVDALIARNVTFARARRTAFALLLCQKKRRKSGPELSPPPDLPGPLPPNLPHELWHWLVGRCFLS